MQVLSKKNWMYLTIIIVTVIFLYAFSSSYTSNNMDNIVYVTALGVDLSQDGKNLIVTFEFMDVSAFSSNQSSESSKPVLDSVVSPTISSAINMVNSYTGKEVNLAHCKVIIFSEDVAKNGIEAETTELMNNMQIRPTTNFIITKCPTTKYIQKSVSKVEKVLTKYYDIFTNSSEYTGYTSDIKIGEFYNLLLNKDCGNLAILGGINKNALSDESGEENENSENKNSDSNSKKVSEQSSEEKSYEKNLKVDEKSKNISPDTIIAGNSPVIGRRGTENIGLAVFNKGKYVGDLTAMDTLCHTLICGEVNSFLITLNENEFKNNNLDIELIENTKPKIYVDVSKENPVINIDIKVGGFIAGSNNLNLDLDKKDDNYISYCTSKFLENKINLFLDKTKNDYKCDINDFYKYAKCHFLTYNQWENYNWNEKYLQSKFNINVNSEIYNTMVGVKR